MTGGGSLIYGLDKRISDAIGVKTRLAPDIVDCVAKGAGIALESLDSVSDPTHVFHKKAYIRD
jgi:rod shape-determining protein MreB